MAYEINSDSEALIETQRGVEISKRIFNQRIHQDDFENKSIRDKFMNDWALHVKEMLDSSSGVYRLTTSHEIIIPYEHD
jgi:hypothetical protein